MAIKHIADGTSLRYIGRAAGSIAKSTVRIAGSASNASQVVSKVYMAMEIVQAVKDNKALSPDQLSHESYDFFRRAVERSVQTPIAAGDQLSVSFSGAMSDAGQIYEDASGDAHAANGLLREIKNRAPLKPEYYLSDNIGTKSSEILSSTIDKSSFASAIKRLERATGSDTKYLFGRILTGEVDADKVLSEGRFEGRNLTDRQLDAFGLLRTYARSGVIAVESQNRLLAGIGWKSNTAMLDFNNVRQVSLRAREFGDALDASCPNGKCPWNRLETKHIEKKLNKGKLGKETISLSGSQKAAAEEYLKLRQHVDHLKDRMRAVRSIRSRRFRLVIRLAQKITGGDSDLLKLISSVRQTFYLGKTIIRTGKLSAKITIRLARMALRAVRTAWHIVRAGARLVNRIPVVRNVTEAVGNAVRSTTSTVSKKVAGSKVGKAANKAADRVQSFSDTLKKGVEKRRAARQARAARKASKKAAKKAAWAKRHPKLAARKAAKAAKLASKKAISSAGKAAGAAIGFGTIALILLIIFIVFMLVLVVALLDSGFFVSELWTEEDRAALIRETADSLRDTTSASALNADYAKNMMTLYSDHYADNYYSAVDLNANRGEEVKKLSNWEHEQETTSKAAVYAFARSYGKTIPVNAYSTARVSIAIANAFVSGADHISITKDLKTAFTEVAYLSHYSLSSITRNAKLVVTEATTQTHTYSCYDTSDLLYMDDLSIVHCQIGDILPLEIRDEYFAWTEVDIEKDRIILVGDSTVAAQTDDGCRYRLYSDVNVDEGAVGSTRAKRTTATKQGNNYVAGDIVFKHFSDLIINNSAKKAYLQGKLIKNSALQYKCTTSDFSVDYMLDPYISSECADNDQYVISDIKSSTPGLIRNSITVHKPGENQDWDTCTNKGIRYCNADCEDSFEGVCPGHEVCLGHYTCPTEHHYCPGHSVQYSTGDLLYRTEIVIDDRMFSNPLKEVEFENEQEYLTRQFKAGGINLEETHYDKLKTKLGLSVNIANGKITFAKLCKTYEFNGFDDLSYHLIQTMLEEDWYEKYNVASRQFAGYSLSPSEQEAVLSAAWLPASMAESEKETRLALLNAACESVGKIPYYPNGKATSAVYEENNFGWSGTAYPEIIENGTAYRTCGLGRSGLIHYLWWNATGEDREGLYVDDLNGYNIEEVTGYVRPGDVLAFVEDGEVVDVVIFAGYTEELTAEQEQARGVLERHTFWFFQFGNEWTELNISSPAKSDTGKWMRVTGIYH